MTAKPENPPAMTDTEKALELLRRNTAALAPYAECRDVPTKLYDNLVECFAAAVLYRKEARDGSMSNDALDRCENAGEALDAVIAKVCKGVLGDV